MKKLKIIYFIFISILIIAFTILSILGSKTRTGYLTDFSLQKETEDGRYSYHARIRYYDSFYRNNDIYGVNIDTKNLPDFIKETRIDLHGSPFGSFISTKPMSFTDKIETEYTLKIRERLIILLLFYISILPLIYFLIGLLKNKKTYLNIKQELNKRERILIFIFLGFIVSIAHIFLLNINYPTVGHDIILIQPRAMSMFLFAQKNGLAIEWASPLFGGGLLQYANPQYHQYSPLYFLTLIMPFWTAYNMLAFLFTMLGFISMFFILKDIFKLDYKLNITGAVFFTCTGYYIYHLQVGHWTFITHPLTAFVVWIFFSDRFNSLIKILLGSLAVSIMIFSGSIQTIFFYTCFTLLGVSALLFEPNKKFIKKCIVIISSIILGFILSISKLLPAIMLAKTIDRGVPMLAKANIFTMIKSISYSFFYPIISFVETMLFFNIKGLWLWEKDISIPFIVFVISIFIILYFKKEFKSLVYSLWINRKANIVLFILWIYLYIDMLFDKGITHSIIPSLNNINLHLRIASSFIVPIIILFILLLSKFNIAEKNKSLFFITINIITILFFILRFSSLFMYERASYANINVEDDTTIWKNIKQNPDKYYVDNISSESETYILTNFLNQSGKLYSSQIPYEPIYGYHLQTFKMREEGSPKKIVDGHFNFTHPNSLLFFNNSYKQFTGFSLDEEADLDKFLHFEKVDWKLPKKFEIADNISLYSHIAVLLLLICNIAVRKIKRMRH